jgi:hypothetical protein
VTVIEKQVLAVLEALSPEKQELALAYLRTLAGSGGVPPSVETLLRFSGALSREDAVAMITAIESGCERVDVSEW